MRTLNVDIFFFKELPDFFGDRVRLVGQDGFHAVEHRHDGAFGQARQLVRPAVRQSDEGHQHVRVTVSGQQPRVKRAGKGRLFGFTHRPQR